MRKTAIALIGGILLSGLTLEAQTPEPPPTSGTDWASGIASATGVGTPPANPANIAQARAMAIRAAIIDAQRNLDSLIRQIPLHADAILANVLSGQETASKRLETVLRGAWQIGQPIYQPDGSISLTIGIKFSDVAAAVLPETGFAPGMLPPVQPPAGAQTGLVLDGRGTHMKAAFLPRILDDRGLEVYGPASVSREFVIQHGLVGYARDLKRTDRVGPNPLMVRVAGVSGSTRCDPALSAEDAEKVRRSVQTYPYLSQGRVLILLD